AVLSMGDIVTAESIKVAGDTFNHDILQFIKKKYKLLIGERTAEDIKINTGTVFEGARNEEIEIRGRDMVSGLLKTITVHSKEVEESVRESVTLIVHADKSVLEHRPSELTEGINDRGGI